MKRFIKSTMAILLVLTLMFGMTSVLAVEKFDKGAKQ